MRKALIYTFMAAVQVLLLASCAALPAFPGSGGGFVDEVVHTAEGKYKDARTQQLQETIEGVIKLVQDLGTLEQQREAICATVDNPSYFSDLEALHETQSKRIASGLIQVADARKLVDSGIAWVEELSSTSDAQAAASAHFLWQLQQAQAGLTELGLLMTYEQKQLAVRETMGTPPETPSLGSEEEYYLATWGAYGSYGNIQPPQCMKDLHARYVELMEQAGTFFYDASITNSSSELDRRSLVQMVDWVVAREKVTLKQQSWVAAQQYAYCADLLAGKMEADAAPQVEFRAIERISPNLYGSLDSILDVVVRATHEQDVVVEVEVAGLSLAHTTKLNLQPGINYFELKPELLPSLAAQDLESAFTTQINYRMTSPDGTIVDAQSARVEILTLYDYLWYDDNFGYAAQYELFAWLRPGHGVVDDLVRRAANYVSDWTDGQFYEINGYQYGDDWYGTLLQVAAIQKAFADSDIAYVMDTYTPRADQRVLTPAAVFEKRQALCIESSLVIASALLSAGMHPMLVVTPGHAQVAVETYADSGQYFLIETTELPYAGLNRAQDASSAWAWNGLVPVYDDGGGNFSWVENGGSSDAWVRYFNWVEDDTSDTYGGIFVLDCGLQRILGINGLESM